MNKPKTLSNNPKRQLRLRAVTGSAKPAKLWAWWDAEQQTYKFLYPQRFCVVICSPDGFKRATREGKGKIVRVTVSPNAGACSDLLDSAEQKQDCLITGFPAAIRVTCKWRQDGIFWVCPCSPESSNPSLCNCSYCGRYRLVDIHTLISKKTRAEIEAACAV